MQAQSKQCAQCGTTFYPTAGRSRAQWAKQRYCTGACANAWRAVHCPGAGAQFIGGAEHGRLVSAGRCASPTVTGAAGRRKRKAAARRLAKAAKGNGPIGRWYGSTCLGCGAAFVARNPGLTCSKRCRKRADNRAHRDAYGNHRERARHYGVAYEPVSRLTIFIRDGYRCRLCGQPTEGTWPAPTSPTLDHVVPLACGGAHVESNLQCACAHCNSLKGHRQGVGTVAA